MRDHILVKSTLHVAYDVGEFGGLGVEGRGSGIDDLEQNPAAVFASDRPRTMHADVEYLGDDIECKAARSGPPHVVGMLDRKIAFRRANGRHAFAGVELLDEFRRLQRQELPRLVLAPGLIEIRLRFVERFLAGVINLGDFKPLIAAACDPQRIVVDADVRGKRRFEEGRAINQILDRNALRIAARRIDRNDDPWFEAGAFRGLRQRFSGCALILDRIVKPGDLALRALQGDLAFELGGDAGVRLDGRCDDLAGAQNDRAESRLDRRADFAFLEREGGVGDVLIDESGPRDGAEARIFGGKIFFPQEIVESLSRPRAFPAPRNARS